MKARRKTDTCLNCCNPLRPEDNYCPICGQENHNLKIPAAHLALEAIESFIHIDSKLWNTLKATFTKPGKITLDYLEGKRMQYVPPVKLYVFVSFIFFLLVGMQSDDAVEVAYAKHKQSLSINNSDSYSIGQLLGKPIHYDNTDASKINQIELEFLDTTSFTACMARLHQPSTKMLDSLLLDEDIDTTAENRKRLGLTLLSIPANAKFFDSLVKAKGFTLYGKLTFATKAEYNKFKEELPFLTNIQLDSAIKARGENPSWFNRQLIRKVGRFNSNDPEDVKQLIHAILKSISLTMFIMMPLTAILLLFIFYRKKYYYEHLIFSIHTHTVFFILFSLILCIQQFISESFGAKCWIWAFLISLIYLILSLKRVYKQSWRRTIFKLVLMSIPYFIVSLMLTLVAAIYGFLA